MIVVQLGDVATIERRGISPDEISDGTTYVGLENIISGGEFNAVGPVSNGDLASTKFKFEDTHILYGKLRPYLAKIAVPTFPGICSTDILPIRVGAHADKMYVTHYLRQPSVVDQVNSMATGANLPRISPKALESVELPLPPLDEQRRIAAILDKADELRTKRRQALAHLDTLTQSIFRSMFGTPGDGWRTARLDEICDVSSGITKGRKTAAEGLTDYPYLAVSNVQDRSLDMSVVKEIAVSAREAERYRLRRGDLLLTEGGDPDKLGRGTIWNDELPWCLHQNHVFRVRPRSVEAVPVYLSWHLASPAAKSYFLRMAKQTTGIASINKTQLSATPLVLPPRELQLAFAARVTALERLKESHRKHLAKLDALFASLQHRAFKGEL